MQFQCFHLLHFLLDSPLDTVHKSHTQNPIDQYDICAKNVKPWSYDDSGPTNQIPSKVTHAHFYAGSFVLMNWKHLHRRFFLVYKYRQLQTHHNCFGCVFGGDVDHASSLFAFFMQQP
eukprot:GHVT01063493.1.p1 GENE.GHVT01063493.1~~GHVT01063493.1.p1  ORF type:complete len:118 (-),score=2.91 GHVT01063493.1:1184-1537(-)